MRFEHERIEEQLLAVQKMRETFGEISGPFEEFEKLLKKYQDMVRYLCPFKVGDRVQLSETREIPRSSGLWCHRGMLRKGAVATVVSTSYSTFHHRMCVDLEFDVNTWIDDQGHAKPLSGGPACFMFFPNQIELVRGLPTGPR